MSYRFNNGCGAVTCDICEIIIDEGLSFKEYKKIYGENNNLCWKCHEKSLKQETEQRHILFEK